MKLKNTTSILKWILIMSSLFYVEPGVASGNLSQAAVFACQIKGTSKVFLFEQERTSPYKVVMDQTITGPQFIRTSVPRRTGRISFIRHTFNHPRFDLINAVNDDEREQKIQGMLTGFEDQKIQVKIGGKRSNGEVSFFPRNETRGAGNNTVFVMLLPRPGSADGEVKMREIRIDGADEGFSKDVNDYKCFEPFLLRISNSGGCNSSSKSRK